MDYKKIIKSQALRLKILDIMRFIPDKLMLKIQYRIKTGRTLNLNNPKRYTEKLQWYKLYYRNIEMVQCVDKYDVREYVKEKKLEHILIPCYGVYNSVKEIDWNSIPLKCVVKDTLGGGGNSVIMIDNKYKCSIEDIKKRASQWTKIPSHKKNAGREWPYYSGKGHRILIEEYLDSNKQKGGLIDYKFLCFNGKAEMLYVLAEGNWRRSGMRIF